MQFNLTFNKPAAAILEGARGIRVAPQGKGKVSFKATTRESGKGIFAVEARTRGGMGITVSGPFADEFLKATKLDRGIHMALEAGSHGFLHGQAVEGKPSKIVPTARLWRMRDEAASKTEDAPARAPRKAGKAKAADSKRGAAGRKAANAKKTPAKRARKSTEKAEAAQA